MEMWPSTTSLRCSQRSLKGRRLGLATWLPVKAGKLPSKGERRVRRALKWLESGRRHLIRLQLPATPEALPALGNSPGDCKWPAIWWERRAEGSRAPPPNQSPGESFRICPQFASRQAGAPPSAARAVPFSFWSWGDLHSSSVRREEGCGGCGCGAAVAYPCWKPWGGRTWGCARASPFPVPAR